MFIKKIKKKHLNTGKNYFVFQLFEETQQKGEVKLNMILSLGPKLNIPESEHQTLADCIEVKARKKVSFREFPKEIEKLAEEFAEQLQKRQFARRKRTGVKSLRRSSSFTKKDSFQDEDDFETKKKTPVFKNKPLALNKLSHNRSGKPFHKSFSSDKKNAFQDDSLNSYEESKPYHKSSRFEKSRSDSKSDFSKGSSRSFDKPQRFNKEDSSDRKNDFKPKKTFSKFGKRPEGKTFSKKKRSFSRFPKKRDD